MISFSEFNVTVFLQFVLIFISIVCIVLFFCMYSIKTKTERAINRYQVSSSRTSKKLNNFFSEYKNRKVEIYNEYLSEQKIFDEWNRRYPFIILTGFIGIVCLSMSLIWILFSDGFFCGVRSNDIFSILVGVCTLISTIMIAVLQLANQKHLRLLENSRQGNARLLAKTEKQEYDINQCFSSLIGFYVYNFSNSENDFLVRNIFKKEFGEIDINFDDLSYLIAIPLDKNFNLLHFDITKIDVTIESENLSDSDKLFYIAKDNTIFIYYTKEQVRKGVIFYCLNNFRKRCKFNISVNLNSKKTNLNATVTTNVSFSSLIYKPDPELDGIYYIKVQSIMYNFN